MVTTAYSDEVGALWSEFEDEVWIIPAERAKEQHKVPLLSLALAILDAVKPLRRRDGFVVPGDIEGWSISNMASPSRPGRQEAARRILADVRPRGPGAERRHAPHMGARPG
jgi:hypothetical protein